jgi:LPS-assembly protein
MRLPVRTLAVCMALVVWAVLACAPAWAQSTPPAKTKSTASQKFLAGRTSNPQAKMLVQADEMVYDTKNDRVSVVGHVQIYYDESILEADRVTYDRKTDRLRAEGNVRYKAKDGNVFHGEEMELTRDFREGFASALLVETPDRTRFAAARAERREGNQTVFSSGVYSACEACKNDPTRPLLWQVKAVRIIHDEREQTIYYQDAQIEFFGIPIAYLPYFYHPDPTVKRKSGFLPPNYYSSSRIGYGAEIPYFWALAPDYDATVSVAPLTRQGALVSGEWRQRLINGAYTVRASGIYQLDKDAFVANGTQFSGYRNWRGALESSGQFFINKRWTWGWDVTALSDRTFLNDYAFGRPLLGEKVSQLYLVGQGDRSHFDLRGMMFTGMSEADRNNELPLVHPVLDYSYISGTPIAGGEWGYKVNFTSLSRTEAEFNPISSTALTTGLCDSRMVTAATNPSNCLMRGIPGDYSRLSTEVTWKRTMVASWGQTFMPFVSVRGDVASRGISADPGVSNFLVPDRDSLVRAMPAVGIETRYPFISVHTWGTQVIEPIAQFIARPNEARIGQFPNEDAQSMVFDDTNLFAINKYGGYDRAEGGGRLNAGIQYTANLNRYGLVNILFGQSYQLFGLNSFAVADNTNVGLTSGLETARSDYVARLYFQPTGNFTFITRARLDKDSLEMHRFELETRSTWDRLTLSTTYGRYDAQPIIGYIDPRESIYQAASYRLNNYWSINGGVRYDLTKSHFDLITGGINYVDECFTLAAQYAVDYTSLINGLPTHRFVMRINLRTVAEETFNFSNSPAL